MNGTQVDTLTTFSGSTRISKEYGVVAGDTITYELIDTNNQLVDSDSQTI